MQIKNMLPTFPQFQGNKVFNKPMVPSFQSLKQDTVSFDDYEKRFLKDLKDFLETRFNGEKSLTLKVMATEVDPENEVVKKTLEEAIEKEQNLAKLKTLLRIKGIIYEGQEP